MSQNISVKEYTYTSIESLPLLRIWQCESHLFSLEIIILKKLLVGIEKFEAVWIIFWIWSILWSGSDILVTNMKVQWSPYARSACPSLPGIWALPAGPAGHPYSSHLVLFFIINLCKDKVRTIRKWIQIYFESNDALISTYCSSASPAVRICNANCSNLNRCLVFRVHLKTNKGSNINIFAGSSITQEKGG